MGDLTPADRGYLLQLLVDRVAALEARQSRLEWQTRVVVSRATVSSTPGVTVRRYMLTHTCHALTVCRSDSHPFAVRGPLW
jgi:hypothetical protein